MLIYSYKIPSCTKFMLAIIYFKSFKSRMKKLYLSSKNTQKKLEKKTKNKLQRIHLQKIKVIVNFN